MTKHYLTHDLVKVDNVDIFGTLTNPNNKTINFALENRFCADLRKL